MISFKEMIDAAFGGFSAAGVDLSSVANAMKNLPTGTNKVSSVVTLLNQHKICDSMARGADVSESIVGLFESLLDTTSDPSNIATVSYPDGQGGFTKAQCEIIRDQLLTNLGTDLDEIESAYSTEIDPFSSSLFSMNGVSPELKIYGDRFSFHVRGAIIMDMTADLHYWDDEHSPLYPEYYEWNVVFENPGVIAVIDPDGIKDTAYTTFSNFEDVCVDAMLNNDAVCALIEAADKTGELSSAAALAILNATGVASSGIATLKTYFASAGSLTRGNVAVIVARFLSGQLGTHDEGSGSFSPVENPSFTYNLIGAVVTILVTVIAVILSVLFRAIAAVVSLLASVAATIFQVIKANVDKTSAQIDGWSDIPALNYPLTMSEYHSQRVTISSAAQKVIDDFGAATYDNPKLPMVPLIISQRAEDDSVQKYVQWMIRPFAPYAAMTERSTITVLDVDDAQVDPQRPYVWTINLDPPANSSASLEYALNHAPFESGNPRYIASTDAELRVDCCDNLWSAINQAAYLFLHNVHLDIPQALYFSNAGYGVSWTLKFVTQMVWDALYPDSPISSLSDPSQVSRARAMHASAIAISVMNGLIDFGSGTSSHGQSYGPSSTDPYGKTSSWDVIDQFIRPLNAMADAEDWVLNVGLTNLLLYAAADSTYLCSGGPVANPNVLFPTVSKWAVIGLVLTTAIVAGAIASATVAIRNGAKRRAVARLARRESEFSEAQKAYLAEGGQTKANAKKLNKANRKLTRAWRKASLAGVSMYNGFDTGSSSTPIATTDSLSEAISMANAQEEAEVMTDSTLSTTRIEHLISGQ